MCKANQKGFGSTVSRSPFDLLCSFFLLFFRFSLALYVQDIRYPYLCLSHRPPPSANIIPVIITKALQTRRTCKAENEVLKPIYDQVVDKNLLNSRRGRVSKRFPSRRSRNLENTWTFSFLAEPRTRISWRRSSGSMQSACPRTKRDGLCCSRKKVGIYHKIARICIQLHIFILSEKRDRAIVFQRGTKF